MPNKLNSKAKCAIRDGERESGLGKASLGEMAPFFRGARHFLLMTACRQLASTEDARQEHKRQRKTDQHVLLPLPGKGCCPQQPPAVDDQEKK